MYSIAGHIAHALEERVGLCLGVDVAQQHSSKDRLDALVGLRGRVRGGLNMSHLTGTVPTRHPSQDSVTETGMPACMHMCASECAKLPMYCARCWIQAIAHALCLKKHLLPSAPHLLAA
jgi:hypothetical protein